jgi:5-methylcytosine-specific restriction protein B
MAERSKALIEVGYYLSKFGTQGPPISLQVKSWKETYALFYEKLGENRDVLQFEHSLKNTRDGFDSYFENTKREGWKNEKGQPAKLPNEAQEVFNQFQGLTEEEVFTRILQYSNHKIEIIENFTDHLKFDSNSSGLIIEVNLINRFTASLLTKPFVILTGLSGSGKTKLAQAFAMWLCEHENQYALVPVGADWTNREPLLGYSNGLNNHEYVKPDSGVLDILIRAQDNFLENEKDVSKCKPYFLILDEMNLSHVERYFADFLSAMESGDEINLYAGGDRYCEFDDKGNKILSSKIPSSIFLPKNLFIVGTVNIDETTYMFSPKVLDRANTIEFRITKEEMGQYLKASRSLKMDELKSKGREHVESFMNLLNRSSIQIDRKKHKEVFLSFFDKLQVLGSEFGYRTANEMTELVAYLIHFGLTDDEAIDVAIMQKLLPKLHGSRSKLSKTLPALLELCEVKYPISLEKLKRMQKGAEENGFASYAEA